MPRILTELPEDHDPDKVYGAIARAEALAAGHPAWWEVTEWPCEFWDPQEPPDPDLDPGGRDSFE